MDEVQEANLQTAFGTAVNNTVRHLRRSLLDFVDLQMALHQEKADPAFWEMFKKRIFNETAILEHEMKATVEIIRCGGVIPPFGRTPEEIDRDDKRKQARINGGTKKPSAS